MSYFPNKLLLNILACGLILSTSMQGATPVATKSAKKNKEETNWKKFVSTERGFSIELPTAPEQVDQIIDIPKSDLKISYTTFLSEPSDAMVYVISVWNYPAQIDMSKPEVNLQEGFGGMLSALPGSEVVSMSMTEIQGFKALEFLVKNEEIYFQGKLLLVYNTLYQIFTVYKDSIDMTDNYSHFINSFQLIQPDKRKLKGKETKV